jgi:hypothetical protein
MNEHRDSRVQTDEDALLRRWYAVSSGSRPTPRPNCSPGANALTEGDGRSGTWL